ncbi:MAG: hypothetical protein D6682_05825 [Zetaproteobacteria bacterium]|nr:MAG: hypothetical protein D6682_05825 [Zetaproteobacteria bacterium]
MIHPTALRHARLLAGAALLALCAGCMQEQPEVPQRLIRQLTGHWQEVDGHSTVRFYDDLSVKLTLYPRKGGEEEPPLRLLSTVEMMERDTLGIALGDTWRGPARIVTTDLEHGEIELHLPEPQGPGERVFRLRRR